MLNREIRGIRATQSYPGCQRRFARKRRPTSAVPFCHGSILRDGTENRARWDRFALKTKHL